jgi:hypothetical protein
MHSQLRRFVSPIVVVLFVAVHNCAADPPASLSSIPADASFYSASLRLGEQMDRLMASKAFATLRDLPAVKFALEHLHTEMAKPDGPAGHIGKVLRDPANRELMELCHDAFRQEVFVFGGANFIEFAKLAAELNGARYAQVFAMLQGQNPQNAQLKAITHTLAQAGDKLQVPEFVVGFRITKAEAASNQIKRLESHLQAAFEKTPLKGRVQRATIGGADALTLTVDGSLIPWDQIPLDGLDDDSTADVKSLFKTLKPLKLALCMLVKDNFLLVTVGPTIKTAESFGRGPSLSTRSEMRPISKYADKPLIGVSYSSAALAAAVATTGEDLSNLVELAKTALNKSPLSADRKTAIEKDLKQLAAEVAAALPKPGGSFGCSFLTARGQETFSYDFGNASGNSGKELTIAEHLGGSPVAAIVGVNGDPTPAYQTLVRWLRVVYGHADAAILELLGEDYHKQFRGGIDMARPYLERFDKITATQLLPAVGAGELAVVLDAKWTSKNWFKGLDQGGTTLPFFELGAVRTVKDSEKVLQALEAYRVLANDVVAKARELGAPAPEGGIPPAESKKLPNGTAYYWPLPPLGLDQQIAPNLALSSKLSVKSLSLKHSERLLTPTPLSTLDGFLEPGRPLLAAAIVDLAAFNRAGRPWIEKFALPAILEGVPETGPPGLARKDIPEQVRKVLDVLQCVRGVRSASYRDGDATVTHSEWIVEDLK